MVNLKRASHELFSRTPDEFFPSLSVLAQHCLWQRQESREIWQPPGSICAVTTRITDYWQPNCNVVRRVVEILGSERVRREFCND